MPVRTVFLDRDGVLNKTIDRCGKLTSPRSMEEFELEPDAADSLEALRDARFKLFVVTNQPEIARGFLSAETLHRMTTKVMESLPIDEVRICSHDDDDGCACRKPKPGMLLDLARRYDVDLEASYLIGDRSTDTMAGRAAGCSTIILDRPYNHGHLSDYRVATLKEAVELILRQDSRETHGRPK
jgi:D-glycero-D-manno-heptose 1,7-bisphosphate phosphatase